MIAAVLSLILVGLVISLPLAAVLIRIGHRLNALDSPGSPGHRKQLRHVPNIGGIAIFWGVAAPITLGLLLLHTTGLESIARFVPALTEHVGRMRESTQTALGMLMGMLVLHVMGLIDDRRGLRPAFKLVVQAGVALVLTLWFDVRMLTALDGMLPLGSLPSILITVGWIVVVINAMNFLDNMDGLAAGVAAIAAALFMAATMLNAQWFIAGTLALLLGSLLGFLSFNVPPARIFMGDGGSLVVGFLLAVLTVRTTFHDPSQAGYALGSGWYGVFMPLVVLAIPIYDCTTVTILRLSQGRSPFVGDQQHFSHRLVQRGLSRRNAVMFIWSLTAVTGVSGIALGSLRPWQAVLVGLQTVLILLLVALLERVSPPLPPARP